MLKRHSSRRSATLQAPSSLTSREEVGVVASSSFSLNAQVYKSNQVSKSAESFPKRSLCFNAFLGANHLLIQTQLLSHPAQLQLCFLRKLKVGLDWALMASKAALALLNGTGEKKFNKRLMGQHMAREIPQQSPSQAKQTSPGEN